MQTAIFFCKGAAPLNPISNYEYRFLSIMILDHNIISIRKLGNLYFYIIKRLYILLVAGREEGKDCTGGMRYIKYVRMFGIWNLWVVAQDQDSLRRSRLRANDVDNKMIIGTE